MKNAVKNKNIVKYRFTWEMQLNMQNKKISFNLLYYTTIKMYVHNIQQCFEFNMQCSDFHNFILDEKEFETSKF